MKTYLKIAIFCSFCLIFTALHTCNVYRQQTGSVTNLTETGNWNGLYLKVKLSDKFGYYGEHHYRRRNSQDNLYDFVGRMRQVYNRAGLNIFFNPYFEAVIGPTLVFNFTPRPGDEGFEKVTLEPRIWHQWLFIMPPMGRFKVYHQFRFEHRWKRDNNVGAEHDYTDRYRYKLFAYISINKKKIEEKTLFFSPSAEIFLHSGKSIVYHPFEDFRIYNGIGYVFNEKITFFGGHMWTLGQDPSGFEYSMNHIIRLNIFVGLDARPIDRRMPNINIGY
ncbi:MAG: DUF2490 domain-containing protein [Bernardetiaceae bacterium]|nr:DUF2490 domain-containing protein [Bernardetiaceae bacterium]